VEIRTADELAGVDAARLLQRLDEARRAFEVIEEYFQTGRLADDAPKHLELIYMEEM
jgi:hypothetical protein